MQHSTHQTPPGSLRWFPRFCTTGSGALGVLLFLLAAHCATAGEMLVDLGKDYTRSQVDGYAAGIAADATQTRLGINSAGTPGQKDFDDQQVTITYTPERAGIKMVAFSDDGVTVTIRDVTSGSGGSGGGGLAGAGTGGGTGAASSTNTASSTASSTEVLHYKGTGQALPNLGQSIKEIQYTFELGHNYSITVDYLNTLYTGGGDVDGAMLIAYGGDDGTGGSGGGGGGGDVATSVEIKNTSRSGDRVVSAKDDADGLPGGTKTLEVKVTPATETATLKIISTGGGTAVFESTGNDTCTVTGTETITMLGRNVSTAARDVRIDASINNAVKASWDFTVFRVGLSAYASGTIDAIPGFQSATSATGSPLSAIMDEPLIGSHKLGHVVREFPPYPLGGLLPTAYGGIVIKGQVVPSGIKKTDFCTTHSRSSSFDWKRVIDSVQFNQNGNLLIDTTDINFVPLHNFPDDPNDEDEDLTPDVDGTANDLLIWSADFPTISVSDVTSEGKIIRERFNALEWVNYASVQVSSKLKWTWRASMENPKDNPKVKQFVQNNGIPGDNVLAVGQWSALSPDLQPVGNNPMTITGFSPVEFDRIDPPVGPEQVAFTVTGTGIPVTPKPIVLLFLHTDNETATTSSFMSLFVLSTVPTEIRGKLPVGEQTPNGSYTVNVFAGPYWSVAPGEFLLK